MPITRSMVTQRKIEETSVQVHKTATKRDGYLANIDSSTSDFPGLNFNKTETLDSSLSYDPEQWVALTHLKILQTIADAAVLYAFDVSEAQLKFSTDLQERREKITNLNHRACKRSRNRDEFKHFIKDRIKPIRFCTTKSKNALEPGSSTSFRNSDSFYKHDDHEIYTRLSPTMKQVFKDTVKEVGIYFKKKDVGAKFDKYLLEFGLSTTQLNILGRAFENLKIASLLKTFGSERNMFKKEYSLAELHKTNSTVTLENLLQLLEKHPETPLFNIFEWRQLKMVEITEVNYDEIDWNNVAEILWFKEDWHVSPTECEAIWYDYLCPAAEKYNITSLTSNLLEIVVGAVGADWKKVSEYMHLPERVCKSMFEFNVDKESKTGFNKQEVEHKLNTQWALLKHIAEETYDRCNGSFQFVAAQLNNFSTNCTFTARSAEKLYLRSQPFVSNGNTKFNIFEDVILLVTLEKLNPIIQMQGSFRCLQLYLPWRMEEDWKLRLRVLCQPWQRRAKLTIQEDMKLIYLANRMPGKWLEMSSYFEGRDRKTLRMHYCYLQNYLANRGNLIDFHRKYGSTRIGIHYPHIKECIRFLFQIVTSSSCKIPGDGTLFKGFSRDRPPKPSELFIYLLLMDRNWLAHTCRGLIKFCSQHTLPNRPILRIKEPPKKKILKPQVLKLKSRRPTRNMELSVFPTSTSHPGDDLNWANQESIDLFNEFLENPVEIENAEYVFPDSPDISDRRRCHRSHHVSRTHEICGSFDSNLEDFKCKQWEYNNVSECITLCQLENVKEVSILSQIKRHFFRPKKDDDAMENIIAIKTGVTSQPNHIPSLKEMGTGKKGPRLKKIRQEAARCRWSQKNSRKDLKNES